MGLRIGVDVGGTFTDFCVTDAQSGARHFFKYRSTPADPPQAIVGGISAILAELRRPPGAIGFLGHGTTTATNMLIERKGAKTALLTTRGFRDVLELGRQARPHLYDYRQQRPPPLVRRALRGEVDERLAADGEVLVPLDPDGIETLAQDWRAAGVEAVAIGFLHAYRNPAHEREAARLLARLLPDVVISLSSEISPEPREYERLSTTVANAFIAPRMAAYADRLTGLLEEAGVTAAPLTISSSGGLLDLARLRAEPVRTALSGPAAGVTGAARLAALPEGNSVTFDVGGTSTDIALLRGGRPAFTTDRAVAGLPIRTAMVNMEVIGAGGGSIAWIDKGGAMRVGPESAGADPGPVAYGLGGAQPTLTDAALVLGWLNPAGLLDGAVPLDAAAARAAIDEQIAKPLDLAIEAASEGILRIAQANMARAIRSLCVRAGVDVQAASLLAYGGAGPLLAVGVAEALGMRRVVVPNAPGTLCAQAMLVSDMALDLAASLLVPADAAHWPTLLRTLEELERRGHVWLAGENIPDGQRAFEVTIEARYRGQNFEIGVGMTANRLGLAAFVERFHAGHARELGFALAGHPIELVTCRLRAIGRIERPEPFSVMGASDVTPVQRQVWFAGEPVSVPIWRRDALRPDGDGPLIIEELSTTTMIPPDWRYSLAENRDLLLEPTRS